MRVPIIYFLYVFDLYYMHWVYVNDTGPHTELLLSTKVTSWSRWSNAFRHTLPAIHVVTPTENKIVSAVTTANPTPPPIRLYRAGCVIITLYFCLIFVHNTFGCYSSAFDEYVNNKEKALIKLCLCIMLPQDTTPPTYSHLQYSIIYL